MRVFICHSGEKGREIGAFLRRLLHQVFPNLRTHFYPTGATGVDFGNISRNALRSTDFGVVVATPEITASAFVNNEVGALRQLGCPVLPWLCGGMAMKGLEGFLTHQYPAEQTVKGLTDVLRAINSAGGFVDYDCFDPDAAIREFGKIIPRGAVDGAPLGAGEEVPAQAPVDIAIEEVKGLKKGIPETETEAHSSVDDVIDRLQNKKEKEGG